MNIWLQLILVIAAIAAGGWVFRFAGQQLTKNAPFYRDMSYGVAFGYVLGAALLLWIASIYYTARTAEPAIANKYFFLRVAIEAFVGFGIIAYYFRLAGVYIGSEGSRKLFRAMPLTAAFGIVTIVFYAFLAVFAGQIASTTIIVLAALGVPLCIYAQVNFRADAAKSIIAIVGATLLVFTVMFFVGPLAPYGQEEIFSAANVVPGGDPAMGGNPDFPLGTDQIGRDILSRLIYGAQNTVGIAFATTMLAFLIGATLGFLAATIGGWLDQGISRAVDVLMAIPSLIFALLLMTIASAWAGSEKGLLTVYMVVIIAVIDSTRVFRLARAVGLNIVVMDYIEAAKLRGEGMGYLIFREILPNATAPLLAEFGLRFCFVFLTIASLSFLGVGIQPPLADWGTMVKDLSQFINFAAFAPQVAAAPLLAASAIALLTVAVNFVVDWMLHKSSGLKE
ncbi:peptide/nickel transport system permease protein [Shimia gijangensis]|uniref:Peptide/nickel transport system permease protein n=1 Tax=Shimia gijangensis TaxID=1470563 RepID=A0A1M6MNF2_9RHOB|nr:ABC transporter permease [Shimia gijangensis]SHJ84916.1 peptide/nickel transport system permease protein [Shimia gijangensis]